MLPLIETPDWIAEGTCHNKPHLTFLFFSDDPYDQAQAKSMCARCPVASFCLVAALERRERFGIWGNTTPADRRRIHLKTTNDHA